MQNVTSPLPIIRSVTGSGNGAPSPCVRLSKNVLEAPLHLILLQPLVQIWTKFDDVGCTAIAEALSRGKY